MELHRVGLLPTGLPRLVSHVPASRTIVWLSQLEHQMRLSLAVEAGREMAEWEVLPASLMDWLGSHPTQTSVRSTQVAPCSLLLAPADHHLPGAQQGAAED